MSEFVTAPPLKVYKASAGSGKTFTLALEYMKLLISNPFAYRNILAVTFTNKATEEMKSRILSQLNGLAHGYADSSDYMSKITSSLGMGEAMVKKRARTALDSLVHNYSSFRVETIDKFFQRVLRNLARELDLTANLRIELNDKQVEQLAVDTMIESLDRDKVVLGWIMSYILETIGEDKSWNVIGHVKSFGENIFKDSYKSKREELHEVMSQKNFFEEYRKKLWSLREHNLQVMKGHATRFFTAIEGYGPSDFSHNDKGIYGYFRKLSEGTFTADEPNSWISGCLDDPEKWSAKKSPTHNEITTLASTTLMGILHDAEADRRGCYRAAKSAEVTLSHLNQLRLLGNIEETVRRLNSESNRFLLSDTQGMLSDMIEGSDTPFIFERISAPLQHIMIDEFQDTGTLQWKNFKVLLNDCMHQGTGNLIVGDVKQSIYRWRSGDWRLLNNITDHFNNDERLVDVESLDTNYRSCRKVVEFNNRFFIAASQQEYQRLEGIVGANARELRTAYSDVVQKVPARKPDTGYVHVELLPKDEYEANIMQKIADTIEHLTTHGVAQRDIAILARNNSDISDTANYFQANVPGINIVSDEAFRLDASLSINIIITAMRVLLDENDRLSASTLAKTYQNNILRRSLTDDEILLSDDAEHTTEKDKEQDTEQDKEPSAIATYSRWLPEGFRNNDELAQLRSKPLTDMVESLQIIFSLDTLAGQSSYLCTFYDTLADYLNDNPSDISRFLEAWEEKYYKKAVHGDDVDGVRIVSIHKSKGLEYDNVILPFCNWQLEKQGSRNIIWCESTEPPFNALPLLPIDYSRNKMENTVYDQAYRTEHLQNSVDNLNLLYVAFTRAKTRMFVFGETDNPDKKGKKKKPSSTPATRSLLIEKSLPLLSTPLTATGPSGQEQTLPPLDCQYSDDGEGTITFDYGECFPTSINGEEPTKPKSKNILLQPEEGMTFHIKSYPSKVDFRQSNDSALFTTTEESAKQRMRYINRGNLLHSIFSRLRTTADMQQVLNQLSFEGVIYDEIKPEELQSMLNKALSDSRVRQWFSPEWTLHNECSIIFTDPQSGKVETLRPDRVMSNGQQTIVVDFKFGKPHDDHHNQVRKYMEKLHKMGHHEVEGYLWYVDNNNIEPVKPE